MNSIKTLLNEIDSQHKDIEQLLVQVQENWMTENVVLELFANAPAHCFSHPKVVLLFADFLQVLNDPDHFNQFELPEVARLYELQLELVKYCEAYEGLAFFSAIVENDLDKGKRIILEGMEQNKKELEVLKDALKSIQS